MDISKKVSTLGCGKVMIGEPTLTLCAGKDLVEWLYEFKFDRISLNS